MIFSHYSPSAKSYRPAPPATLRARRYHPALGAFLSRDPLPVFNRYGYVDGNPVMRTDPSGLLALRTSEGGGGLPKKAAAKEADKLRMAQRAYWEPRMKPEARARPYRGRDEYLPPEQQSVATTSTLPDGTQRVVIEGNASPFLGSRGCPPGFRTQITGSSRVPGRTVFCERLGGEGGSLYTIDMARADNRSRGLGEYYYPARSHDGRLEIAGIQTFGGIGWHVFLVYTAEDGDRTQFYGSKGGPQYIGSTNLNSSLNTMGQSVGHEPIPAGMLVTKVESERDQQGQIQGDLSNLVEAPQALPDNPVSLHGVDTCLRREFEEMNSQVPYNLLGSNSSSVVYTALIRCGVTPQLPSYVDFTTGWGVVIPDIRP